MNPPEKALKLPRILIAASIYPPDPGGPATHAKRQFEGFTEAGFEVRLVALAHYRRYPMGIRHGLYLFKLFAESQYVDIVYAHDALGVGLPALIVSKFMGKKMMARVGGDIPWEREAESRKTDLSMNEWYRTGLHIKNVSFLVSRFVLRKVDALVVPSQLLADLYATYYGVRKNIISVIANPISNISKDTTATQSSTIIFASRLVAYKNLPFVLTSLVKIFPKHAGLQFVIMGDGPEKTHLEQLARKLDIESQVLFTGSIPQEKVVEYTKICLLGVAPALTEFNPNYILECIAYGKPFLMSRENGLPFQVPESLLFDTRNSKEFEEKLESLLDPEQYAKAKLEIVNIHFQMSWSDVVKKNIELIKSIANQ